jgi:hypothetical protein
MKQKLRARAIVVGVAMLAVGTMAACEPPTGPLPAPPPETPPPATVAPSCPRPCHDPLPPG